MMGKLTLWLPTMAVVFVFFIWGSAPVEAEEKRLAELNIGSDRASQKDREALAAKLKEIMGKRTATGDNTDRQRAIQSILGKRSAELDVHQGLARMADEAARDRYLQSLLDTMKHKRLAELDLGSDRSNLRDEGALRDLLAGITG